MANKIKLLPPFNERSIGGEKCEALGMAFRSYNTSGNKLDKSSLCHLSREAGKEILLMYTIKGTLQSFLLTRILQLSGMGSWKDVLCYSKPCSCQN